MLRFRRFLPRDARCAAIISLLLMNVAGADVIFEDHFEITKVIRINTGIGANQKRLRTGDLDPNWRLTSVPEGAFDGSTRAIEKNPSWFDSGADASWITSRTVTDGVTTLPSGDYVYEFEFEIQKQGSIFELNGFYGSDNNVARVTLNGSVLVRGSGADGCSGPSEFGEPAFQFSFSSRDQRIFKDGVNTLGISVFNCPTVEGRVNPSALVVRGELLQTRLNDNP